MLAEIFGVDGVIVLIVVVVLLFGGAAIPKLARNLVRPRTSSKRAWSGQEGLTRIRTWPEQRHDRERPKHQPRHRPQLAGDRRPDDAELTAPDSRPNCARTRPGGAVTN